MGIPRDQGGNTRHFYFPTSEVTRHHLRPTLCIEAVIEVLPGSRARTWTPPLGGRIVTVYKEHVGREILL